MKNYKLTKKTTIRPNFHIVVQDLLFPKPKFPLKYFKKIHPIAVAQVDFAVVDFVAVAASAFVEADSEQVVVEAVA